MDNRSLSDDLSKLFSSENEDKAEGESTGEQENALIERLKALSGNAEEGVGKEVNEFLEGKGALLESTRAAVQTGKRSAVKELAAILADKFGLSSPLAQILATLLVQLFPNISKLTGGTTSTKPKPRRRTKPKTSSGKKTTQGSKAKKRKTASSAKRPASSKTKKRKTASGGKSTTKKRKTTSSKKTAARSKTRKRRTLSRTLGIPAGED